MGVLETILLILGLVIAIVLLLVLAYQMGKHKNLVPIVVGVVYVIVFGFSMYCLCDLNYYYTAQGGVFGVLTGLYKVNIVESQEGLDYSLSNIEFKQIDGDEYGAKITISQNPQMQDDVKYCIFINGVPLITSEVDKIHAKGSYMYNFYDKNMKLLLHDTLDLSFAFYENYTTLQITTNGGSDAVKQWNSYFQKQNFKITIEQSPFDLIV